MANVAGHKLEALARAHQRLFHHHQCLRDDCVNGRFDADLRHVRAVFVARRFPAAVSGVLHCVGGHSVRGLVPEHRQ